MTFYAFGLNHRQAPVQLRERFALGMEDTRALLRAVTLSDEGELIVLSTCNRTEAYVYGTEADVAAVRAEICGRTGTDWPEASAFAYQDEAAVRHVLHVACGLESLVLGDAQIFAQLKDAYRLAVDEDRVSTAMHRLMHTAFRTAKRVINETGLNTGAASVPRVAVQVARTRFAGALRGRNVLLVGAGEMGRQAAEALHGDELATLAVTNRSAERAHAFAGATGAVVQPWSARHQAAAVADVVVVATAADAPVLTAAGLEEALSAATTVRERPVLLIDISVPRNVDRAVDELAGFEVVDLDDLNAWLVETEVARRAAVPAAERICEGMLGEFVSWVFHQQALQPAIQAIRDTFENIRFQEVERHHHRLSDLDRVELDRLTQSIIQKLLAVPVVRLKSVDPESVDFVHGIKLLHALFSRPDCEDESAAHEVASERGAAPALSQARAMQGARCAAPSSSAHHCPFFETPGAGAAPEADPGIPLHLALRQAVERGFTAE